MLNELEQMVLEEEEEKGFKVNDLKSSAWCIRKLKSLDKREKEVKELAKEEVASIKDWEKSQLKELEGDKNYFKSLLREYYEKQKEEDDKFTLSTPYGTFYTMAKEDKIEISRELKEALIEEYKENEEVVKTTYSLILKGFKDKIVEKDGEYYNSETGEKLEGITILPQQPTEVVRFKK